jgi:hypothetical protein
MGFFTSPKKNDGVSDSEERKRRRPEVEGLAMNH